MPELLIALYHVTVAIMAVVAVSTVCPRLRGYSLRNIVRPQDQTQQQDNKSSLMTCDRTHILQHFKICACCIHLLCIGGVALATVTEHCVPLLQAAAAMAEATEIICLFS